MKRICSVILLLVIVIPFTSKAQLINYNKNGKRFKFSREIVRIYITTVSGRRLGRVTYTPVSLTSLLPGVIGAGFSIAKEVLSQQQEKYTATYSTTESGSGLIYMSDTVNSKSPVLNFDTIIVTRIVDDTKEAMEVAMVPEIEAQAGLFRLKVVDLQMPLTKAKIKKCGRYGKTIDLSLDIKLEAYWKEQVAASTAANQPDPHENRKNRQDTTLLKSQLVSDTTSFQTKSSTLGESSILIPGIYPNDEVSLSSEHPFYSGWFQTLPIAAVKFATPKTDWKTGWYTLTITFKEVNGFGVTSKQRSDFLNATSGDISTLLKQLAPSK